jgi:hypothetical protein
VQVERRGERLKNMLAKYLPKYIDRNAFVFRYTRLTMLSRLHSLTCICSHCRCRGYELQLMPKRAGRGGQKGRGNKIEREIE